MSHPLIFSVCSFLMVMLLVGWVGYRLIYKPGKFLKQLGRPAGDAAKHLVDANAESEPSAFVTVLRGIGKRVPSSDKEVGDLKADLIRWGFRSEGALPLFYGLRILSTLVMLMVCVAMESRVPPNPVIKIGLMFSGVAAGWILPRFFLEKKVKKRKTTLRLSLPDALDLLVVSIEAGLGAGPAVAHVARGRYALHPRGKHEISPCTL